MKAYYLELLWRANIRVPLFDVVSDASELKTLIKNPDEHRLFAVRSSCDVEDSEKESHAGQFLTKLNVPKEGLDAAIKEVKASYGDNPGDKVIVQEMIVADYSGVAFSVNPIGILNESVITVGKGLGDGVVDDKTSTSTYYYNQDDESFYMSEKSDIKISEDILLKIIENLRKIKLLMNGHEVDIEFAIKDDLVYILQARPVTTIDANNPVILDASNIRESYPSVACPATQDFVRIIYADMFASCVKRMTWSKKLVKEMRPIFNNMVATYNGKIYYQINNWYEVLRLLPYSNKIIKIWQEMLGISSEYVPESKLKVRFRYKVAIVFNFLKYLIFTPLYMHELNDYFDTTYPRMMKEISRADSLFELCGLFDMLEKSITKVWDITLVNDMYAFIFTKLAGGNKNPNISNIKNIESMKPVIELQNLAQIAKRSSVNGAEYKKAAQKFISVYGDRVAGELMLEQPTYRTNPELLDQAVKSVLKSNDSVGNNKDKIKKSINPFVLAAKSGISNREKSRMNRSRLFGAARSILLKIGMLLVESEQLEKKEDVFYLHLDELYKEADLKTLVAKRKEVFEQLKQGELPTRVVFSNGIVPDNRFSYISDSYKSASVLHGTKTSIGKVIADAVVIDQPTADMNAAGKIIVAKSTDPGWVFLIKQSAGIIAEHGSLLSHTAIISRELKKPAIVNVSNATQLIHTGDKVELDATSGVVRIIGDRNE